MIIMSYVRKCSVKNPYLYNSTSPSAAGLDN